MKNKLFPAFIALLSFSFILSSCSHYKSIDRATKMVDLARNPFMKKLALSIFKDIDEVSKNSNSPLSAKVTLTSDLNEVIPAGSMPAFIQLISTKYHIPFNKADDIAPTWRKVRDVIGFVGKFGSGFQFYKM